jgi:hypothetical protein
MVDMDGSFPMRRYTQHLDLWFKSYEVLKISAQVGTCCQPLSNAAKSAQNCPKLSKTAQICQHLPEDETLKFHQKSRFQYFSKIKIRTCRGGTRACFHCSDFQSKNFHMLFLLSKNGLCM